MREVVRRGMAKRANKVAKSAPTKKVDRSAISRLRISCMRVTSAPPRNMPMGMLPQAKKRYTLFTRPSNCVGMMLCRSETVMTFHKTAKKVSMAVKNSANRSCCSKNCEDENACVQNFLSEENIDSANKGAYAIHYSQNNCHRAQQ